MTERTASELDNLLAWADQLFRRDTIETIEEATQLYVVAAEILGRRPEDVPPRVITSSNDKLLSYWDTVADRLFKIRHCMNIEGIERQLPLFEPPIDPGLLVRTAAAGVNLESAIDDIRRGNETGLYAAFNLRQDFANEWQALKSTKSAKLKIEKCRFPQFLQTRDIKVDEVRWFAKLNTNPASYSMDLGDPLDLTPSGAVGRTYEGKSGAIALETEFALSATSTAELDELVILVKYTVT